MTQAEEPARATGRTLDEELARSARRAPDEPALWAPGQGELTFARWAEAVAKCATRLAGRGVMAGRLPSVVRHDAADGFDPTQAEPAVSQHVPPNRCRCR
jgi:non-ribosomal peptide synthetase component E (peptide arylation enzyme)